MAAINTKVKKPLSGSGIRNQDVAGDKSYPERDATACR